VHFALVTKKVFTHSGRIIAQWKVAREWAKGNVPMLGSVLLEVSGRGEGLLAFPIGALEHARCICLVIQHMCLKVCSFTFDDFAAAMALKLIGIEFRLILSEEESFMIVQMYFEIGDRCESLVAFDLGALDDSRRLRAVFSHVQLVKNV
jgi:hypothetical protein